MSATAVTTASRSSAATAGSSRSSRSRPPRAASGRRGQPIVGTAVRLVNLAGLAAVLVLNLAGDNARGAAAASVRTRLVADSLAGQLLVATPQLTDPRFVQTVVYLVRYDASGAMGL